MKCKTCGQAPDLRGALTLLIVLLVFGLAYFELLQGGGREDLIPPWAAALVASATTGYLMSRSAQGLVQGLRGAESEPPPRAAP